MKRIISIVLVLTVMFTFCSLSANAEFENTHVNTGDYSVDIARIALTQMGYNDDNDKKYGNDENYSLNFLTWCANQAAISESIIPQAESVSELYDFFKNNSRLHTNDEYSPKQGDILFLSDNDELSTCAIVMTSDEQYVTAVINDYDNTVKKKLYELDMTKIVGYANPDYSYVENHTSGTHMTTASFLNLRSQPSTESTVLAKIPIGTVVDVTQISGNWGYIQYGDFYGWISMDYAVSYNDSHTDTSEYSVNWTVIDVSKWQGEIDWTKVASGDIQGVIMRIGLRGTKTREIEIDENFLTYYQGAKNAGLHIGVYFYTTATTVDEVLEEAEFVIDTLKTHNIELDMPLYLDMEDAMVEKCGKTAIFNMTYAFLERMSQENIYSGVYCGTYWAQSYYNEALFTNYALWIAEWRDSCSYDGEYGMWQYTSTGGVSGISSRYTDLNICYIDYSSLISDLGYNTEKAVIDVEEVSSEEDVSFSEIESDSENSSEPESETVAVMRGDVDNNGVVTASDARLALRFSALLDSPTSLQERAADVNNDGYITASDARTILRISAKLEN